MVDKMQADPLGTFYYSSLECLLVYFQVDAELVSPFLLKGTGLEPAIFDNKALVNFNWERYANVGGTYDGMCNEAEFNVVSYPERFASRVLDLSLWQFLMGEDETKLYGNYRASVPCDSHVAVVAGRDDFGEVKFDASFEYQVPNVNDPALNGWWLRCYPTIEAPTSKEPYIFDLKAEFQTTRPGVTPFSPLPAWANLTDKEGKKYFVMSARNIFGTFQGWFTGSKDTPVKPLKPGTVQLTVGKAQDNPMHGQLKAVFADDPPAVAILLYQSPPSAASTHTKLLDPVRIHAHEE